MVTEMHAAGQVVSGGELPAFEFVVVGGGGEVCEGLRPAGVGDIQGSFDVVFFEARPGGSFQSPERILTAGISGPEQLSQAGVAADRHLCGKHRLPGRADQGKAASGPGQGRVEEFAAQNGTGSFRQHQHSMIELRALTFMHGHGVTGLMPGQVQVLQVRGY